MRLLNIKTGYLEIVNIENFKFKYISISHRWLTKENNGVDELELLDLGLVGIGKDINIGERLYDHLYSKIKCSTLLNNIQIPIHIDMDIEILNSRCDKKNKKWKHYLKIKNIIENNNLFKEIYNHCKLLKIINNIIDNDDYEEIKYIWLDTLCIDKSSSAELSENIVSMYQIYQSAKYVYVYLNNDYIKKKDNNFEELLNDEWFTRGWTLQEYLANENVNFYNKQTQFICNKQDIWKYTKTLYNNDIIRIPSYLFEEYDNICKVGIIPIGTILSWMEERKTTKKEDKIYSLMGLLNTYITPLYGEKYGNAKNRLINEYILNKKDDSIFNIFEEYDDDKSYFSIKYNHNNIINIYENDNYNNYIKEMLKINGKFKITAPVRIIEEKNIEVEEINKENESMYKKWCKQKKLDYNFSNNNIFKIYMKKKYLGIIIKYRSSFMDCSKINCLIYFGSSNQVLANLTIKDNYYYIYRLGKFISSQDLKCDKLLGENFNSKVDFEFISDVNEKLNLYNYCTFILDDDFDLFYD